MVQSYSKIRKKLLEIAEARSTSTTLDARITADDSVAYADLTDVPSSMQQVFYQSAEPSSAAVNCSSYEVNAGDVWIDADNFKISYFDGTSWNDAHANLDVVPDGTSYKRISGTYVSNNKVIVAGDTSNHVVLDGSNGLIYVNDSTFGNDGIQVDYNSGNPRFYCGDGSTRYVKFDGTNVTVRGAVDIIGGENTGNLLINSGFEETDGTNAFYWTSGAGITTETSGGDDSNKYLAIVRSGSDKASYRCELDGSTYKYIEVNEGEVYEYGCSARSSNGSVAARMVLGGYDKDKANPTYSTIYTTGTSWTTITNKYTVPSGKKFLFVWVDARDSDGTASFDNCYVRKIATGLNSSFRPATSVRSDDLADSVTTGTSSVNLSSAGVYGFNAGSTNTFYLKTDGTFRVGDANQYLDFNGSALTLSTQVSFGINSATWQADGIQLQYNSGNPRAYIGDGSNKYIQFDGTDVTLGSQVSFGINSATWQSDGIQLQYNAGNPRFYCGNGSNDYLQFDGTNVEVSTSKADAIVIKSGADIKLETGGDVKLYSATSGSTANVEFHGNARTYFMGVDYDNDRLCLYTDEDGLGAIYLGWDESGNNQAPDQFYIRSSDTTSATTYVSAKGGANTLSIDFSAHTTNSSCAIMIDCINTQIKLVENIITVKGTDFRPLTTNTTNLGTASYCWANAYVTGGSWGSCACLTAVKDYTPTQYGLEFINKLIPVDFRYNEKSGLERDQTWHGFLGEELLTAINEMNVVDGGIQRQANEKDLGILEVLPENFSVRLAQFVPIIVKAIQELDKKVDTKKDK